MIYDEETILYNQIFQPGMIEEFSAVFNGNRKFAYYTSSATAMKIVCNQELWFRNSQLMNDYSEISYGLGLIETFFNGEEGERFRSAVDAVHPGTMDIVRAPLAVWQSDWIRATYIACLSLHDSETEDKNGRLSMWRAYGDTALIINNTPIKARDDQLGVYSIPVRYLSQQDLTDRLSTTAHAIHDKQAYLRDLGQEALVKQIRLMLFQIAIATKHPGFAEEKEWRFYYRPTARDSQAMTEATMDRDGARQTVYKLRLAHEPDNGLLGADIPSLIDRIIIGPTEFPHRIHQAFVDVLNQMGVEGAEQKVVISDIPLRVG